MENLHLWFYLLCILPSVIIAVVAVFFFQKSVTAMHEKGIKNPSSGREDVLLLMLKGFMDREERYRAEQGKLEMRKHTLPLQLQAYERCILLLERINPSSLILRVSQKGMSAFQLQTAMISAIREEFEHNLSQQLYVDVESWENIRKVKEELIRLVNTSAAAMEDNAMAASLATSVLEKMEDSERFSIPKAIDFIKTDAKKSLF
ncbi:MAG: hypothetical protein Q7J34_08135 [Bacteroidales bacterium]|nr:hypothetical protein [Bacteroidales bacterium]